MNVPFVVGAILALTAAGIHSIVGERLVVSRLRAGSLPEIPRWGPDAGRRLIRGTWHLLSVAFAGAAIALATQAFAPADEATRAVGRAVATLFFGFALLIVLYSIRNPKMLRHPAWVAFLATGALAWWGGG